MRCHPPHGYCNFGDTHPSTRDGLWTDGSHETPGSREGGDTAPKGVVTGFVGPYLANELANEPGVELFGMAWNGNDHATAALLPAGLETLIGDITDDGSIHEVLEAARPDAYPVV